MSDILENTIKQLQLDKSNWQTVKFGNVAIQQKENVDRVNTALTRYIKGEHMNSEDLHIRTWGELTDEYLGPAFIRKFEKGDILYGSRRTYLRKVAIADFDGITSNTTFVIKANENKINKRLLPFIMMSEGFTENSIKNSKGSVNPYINWKDIAKYEFLLPPKDQQAQLAELLWAMDEVIERENIILGKLEQQKLITIESLLTGKKRVVGFNTYEKTKESKLGSIPTSWHLYKLKDILIKGRLGGNYQNGENEKGLPLIKMGNLSRGKINLDKVQRISEDIDYDSEDILKEGDLLFNTRNTLDLVGKVAIWKNELPKALYNSNIMRFEFNNDIISSNDFMNLVLNSRRGINQLRSFATGTTSVAAIYSPELMRFKCVIPSKNEQDQIVKIVDGITYSINAINTKLETSKALQKSLINQVF